MLKAMVGRKISLLTGRNLGTRLRKYGHLPSTGWGHKPLKPLNL